MKTRNTFTNALALIALAAGLVVIIAAWQTRQVQAVQGSEDFPSDFGFIDLGAGQTARLNVVNLRRQPPPDPTARHPILKPLAIRAAPGASGSRSTFFSSRRRTQRDSRASLVTAFSVASRATSRSCPARRRRSTSSQPKVRRSLPRFIHSAGRTRAKATSGSRPSRTSPPCLKCVRARARSSSCPASPKASTRSPIPRAQPQ